MIDERDVFAPARLHRQRIVAEQHLAVQRRFGGIVLDGDEIGKNLLAHFAGERLAFADVLLAEAFGAVPENFMEEDGGGAAGEQRGAGVGIDERRLIERFGFAGSTARSCRTLSCRSARSSDRASRNSRSG